MRAISALVTSLVAVSEDIELPFTLWSGDLCDLTPDTPYDVLIISGKYDKRYGDRSAFYPSRGSVLGALNNAFGLDFTDLPDEREFEYYAENQLNDMNSGVPFDAQRHTWCLLSTPLVSNTDRALPFSRVMIIVPPRSYAEDLYTHVWRSIEHAFSALNRWSSSRPEDERLDLKVLSTMTFLGRTQDWDAHINTLDAIIDHSSNRGTLRLASFDLITYWSKNGSPFHLEKNHNRLYKKHFQEALDTHQDQKNPQGGHDLFISYRHDRTDEVDAFVSAFRERYPTWEVWYDAHISAGESWQSMILRGMRSARMCLMIISDGFSDSRHCLDELDFALEINTKKPRYLFPIVMGDEAERDRLVRLAPSFAKTEFKLSTWDQLSRFIDQLNIRLESLPERSDGDEPREADSGT